jgi:hypothetical protein
MIYLGDFLICVTTPWHTTMNLRTGAFSMSVSILMLCLEQLSNPNTIYVFSYDLESYYIPSKSSHKHFKSTTL